jgi:peptide/nickel transport system substrate-binding protein
MHYSYRPRATAALLPWRSRWIAIALTSLTTVAAAACSSSPATTGTAASPVPTSLTIVQTAEPTSLNPSVDTARTTLNISQDIVQSLVVNTSTSGYAPLLATSWDQVAPDVWRITLRQNVRFSDGEPLNSAAVVFSLHVWLTTTGDGAGVFSFIKSVKPINNNTFEFITTVPTSTLPPQLSWFSVFPPKYYAKVGGADFGRAPVGTGPYKFVSWTPGEDIKLTAFSGYWGSQPQIKNVTFRFAPDASTAVAMLLSGEANLITEVPPQYIPQLTRSSNIKIETIPSIRRAFLQMNIEQGPTSNVLVRKALSYAIDVNAIISKLFLGHAVRYTGIDYPGFEGYTSEPSTSYDPAKAKQLLAQAGYPHGFTIDFWYPVGAYELDQESCQAVAAYLAQVGIHVVQHPLSPGAFFTKVSGSRLPGLNFITIAPFSNTPVSILDYEFGGGNGYYYGANATTERYATQLGQAQTASERIQLVDGLQNYVLNQEVPYVWLWLQQDIYAMSQNLSWQPFPDGTVSLYSARFTDSSS